MRGYSLFDQDSDNASGVLTPRENRSQPAPELLSNWVYVEMLYKCVGHEGAMLTDAPFYVAKVLEGGLWRSFADDSTWVEYKYTRLDDFVKAQPPGGLGLADGAAGLRAVIRPYAEDSRLAGDKERRQQAKRALALIDEETPAEPKHGAQPGNKNAAKEREQNEGDNVTSVLEQRGNSETYLLRRLKRDRPELAERVIAGEVTAHAAAVEAGFRQRMVQIQPTVPGFLKAAQSHLSPEQRLELKEAL